MKRLLVTSIFTLALYGFTGCDKNSDADAQPDTITATVKSNEVYSHDFGMLGIEDGAQLKKSPDHADSTSLTRDGSSRLVFLYQPKSDYRGTDEATITICRSAGSAGCYATEEITLRLTVVD